MRACELAQKNKLVMLPRIHFNTFFSTIKGKSGQKSSDSESHFSNRSLDVLTSSKARMSKKNDDTKAMGQNEQIEGYGETEEEPSTPLSQSSRMLRISKLMMGGGSSSINANGNGASVQDDVQNENSKLHNSDGTDEQAEGSNTIKGIDGLHGSSSATPQSSARWNALRQRLRENAAKKGKGTPNRKARVVGQMSVVTEMQTGILPVFMIKMSMERDEQGHRRIPVLLNHLHLRISDSVNPLHTSSAVFSNRIRVWGWLDQMGGYQGKQGYLRILSRSSRKDAQGSLLTPVTWIKAHEPKWCIVRESYIAIVDQPDSTQVFDVFLLDNQFEIERPKRLYRQTLHLAQDFGHGNSNENSKKGKEKIENEQQQSPEKTGETIEIEPTDKQARSVGKQKSKSDQKESTSHSAALEGKDETAILTEGHFRDPGDDEYSGSHRSKADAKVSSHTFHIKNAERKLKLVANNERQMNQFIASMERVAKRNIFGKKNRFESFAPIRLNCNARWIVDGRDYYWQTGSPKYRLDNILKRKAEEGVKIFVIVYNEVSNNFTPTDSNYTKQRLIGLHPNIFVQRSPSHFQTGTFYWAHHEKLCVIDETIAFMGGLDLCFGRWDTSSHVLTDNHLMENEDAKGSSPQPVGSMAHSGSVTKATGKAVMVAQHHEANLLGPGAEGREFYVWPGQDFANERVVEWHDLTKPEADLFDREHFPRMPWHDIGLQLIGQPARDLCRHFTQRWNLLLRIKNHKRLMPFLIPPADFSPSDLKKFDLTGTCEAQICRSAGPWSMGTANTVEHSIQNAYLKSIQMSDHFVYIENQFFVTSTEARGTVIENMIGEALVSRIIRAEREKTAWKAIIVIPLIPGFPMPIDHPDASSVRLIVDLQYRSISRGEDSIFSKLRRRGIDPEQYISFFSLRQWGKLPSGRLTTEQVYIHAKAMIVDDRLAIIGSANINERSQRGDRDSELACVVRDTDMIDSTMAGKSYKVGRFAHTLRIRLMREHLGYDVDADEVQGYSDCDENNDDNRQLFIDPLDPKFFKDLWVSSATHNTQIFRKVFRSVPDDMVTTWPEYKAFQAWYSRLSRSGGNAQSSPPPPPPTQKPPKRSQVKAEDREFDSDEEEGEMKFTESEKQNDTIDGTQSSSSSSNSQLGSGEQVAQAETQQRKVTGINPNPSVEYAKEHADDEEVTIPTTLNNALPGQRQEPQGLRDSMKQYAKSNAGISASHTAAAQPIRTEAAVSAAAAASVDEGFSQAELEEMERMLQTLRGTLVHFSTRFLETEDRSDNFLFPMDKINPLNVYA
ncbi:hypothetical protein L7F22_053862 [Adiantum nelumboides]|nr:hypothetical protein [Adiantum nelumboides]